MHKLAAVPRNCFLCHLVERWSFRVCNDDLRDAGAQRPVNQLTYRLDQFVPKADIGRHQQIEFRQVFFLQLLKSLHAGRRCHAVKCCHGIEVGENRGIGVQ